MTAAIELLEKKILKTQKEINKLKNSLSKDFDKLFKMSCKKIFKDHKDFHSFSWVQYTPYWNDGDTCTFSAHTDSIYIDDIEDSFDIYNLNSLLEDLKNKDRTIKKLEKENAKLESEGSTQNWTLLSNKERIKELERSSYEDVLKKSNFLKDVCNLLDSVDEEFLESMFGDHCKVTVSKNGIDVESYKHD